MKLHITYKSPDAVHYALERLHPDDHERAQQVVQDVIGSQEYIDIELDIDTGDYKIIKRKY